jgi:hypothetical protein
MHDRWVTQPPDHEAPAPPPGPPAAHPWAEPDRPRGLDAYFPPGGEDEATNERRRDDQRMVRWLVIFVALLVGVPTVLTLIAFAGQLLTMRGAG